MRFYLCFIKLLFWYVWYLKVWNYIYAKLVRNVSNYANSVQLEIDILGEPLSSVKKSLARVSQ